MYYFFISRAIVSLFKMKIKNTFWLATNLISQLVVCWEDAMECLALSVELRVRSLYPVSKSASNVTKSQ
jgi:hypothetical protein